MRLKKIVLSGFRAFANATTFDLDADCVIVAGSNGQGKTSLLDGIFWALTGSISRIGADGELVSLYSPTGTAVVALTLDSEEGDIVVSRRFDGARSTLHVTVASEPVELSDLRRRFGRIVAPPSQGDSEEEASFATTMARSLYLQQDAIRDFLNADSDDARFRIVAELCGLGRVTELQAALQQERRNWTQATSQFESQAAAKKMRLAQLQDRAERLTGDDFAGDTLTSEWRDWWATVRQLIPSFAEPAPETVSPTADSSLDRAVRLLEVSRLEAQRALDSLVRLESLRSQIEPSEIDTTSLTRAVDEAQQYEVAAREALKAVEASNVAAEQELLNAKAKDSELRTLSELALRHLSETCPVCEQSIDPIATAERLRRVSAEQPAGGTMLKDISPFIHDLHEKQQRTLSAREALRVAEAAALLQKQQRAELERQMHELGLTSGDSVRDSIMAMRQAMTDRVSSIEVARARADKLSLARARANELSQRAEVAQQLVAAKREVEESERVLTRRQRAGRVATSIAEEMREASLKIVDSELKRIEPLFQRIWSGIDPHPSLRAVQLISRLSYGKGRLTMLVRDEAGNVSSESPEAVLSSSQQNALAVALFLALNVGAQSLALSSAVLDDPFQSLDDINLLGLVDLLRRIASRRQLILTTHEPRFAQLLARKLRPVEEQHSTKIIELDGWDRANVAVSHREISRDTSPFRFVA